MPTVPRIDQQRASLVPLPGARLTVQTPGGAFAGPEPVDLSGVQKIVASIWQEERDKADQIAVLDAESKLADTETRLLYDPKTGVLNRKGKDAFTAPEEVSTAWQQAVSDIESGLSTDRQRLAFKRTATSRAIDVNRVVQRHVAGEMETYDKDVTESFLVNERNTALASYNDENRVQLSVDRQKAALEDFGKRNGWASEKIARLTAENVSRTREGVINRMLANDQDLAASAYYQQHKGDIVGEDAANIEKALEEGSLRGESQRQADQIVKVGNRADALAKVRQIKDPKVRDEVESRVNRYFSEMREIKNENQNDLYLRATNILDAHPGVYNARSVISPHIWSQLDLGQRNALEHRAKGDDDNQPNNNGLFLDFLSLDPKTTGKLSRSDFESKYWSKFDKSHRERAAVMWAAAQDQLRTGKMDPKIAADVSFNQQFTNTLKTSGFIDADKTPTKWGKDKAMGVALMEQKSSAELDEFQRAHGRLATVAERQEIIDRAVVQKVFISRFGRDKEVQAGMVTEDQRGRAYVPHDKIPPAEKNAIYHLIQSKGARVTNDKIERAYAAFILNDTVLFNSIIIE